MRSHRRDRAGRMVATGTMEDLKRNAARRMTVDFREPIDRSTAGAAWRRVHHYSERQWIPFVRGPLGR